MEAQQELLLVEPRTPEERTPWLTDPALLAAAGEKVTISARGRRCEVPLAAARAFSHLVDKIVSGLDGKKHCIIIDVEGAEQVLKPLQELITKGSCNINMQENSKIRNVCDVMKMKNNAVALSLSLDKRRIEKRIGTKNSIKSDILETEKSTFPPTMAKKRSLIENLEPKKSSPEDQKILAMAANICRSAAISSRPIEQPAADSMKGSLSPAMQSSTASNGSGRNQQGKLKRACTKSADIDEKGGVEDHDNEDSDENEGLDERYEVARITRKRENPASGETEYRVQWKLGDVTWEGQENLTGAEGAIEDFEKLERNGIVNSKVDARLEFFKSLKRCEKAGCLNIGFRNSGGLKQHENKVHSGNAQILQNTLKFECEICGQRFTRSDGKKGHKDRMHRGLAYGCKRTGCEFVGLNCSDAYAHCQDSGHNFDADIEIIKDPMFDN